MTLPSPSPIFAVLRRLPRWRRVVLARADRLAGPEADATLSRWVACDPGHLALQLRHAFGAHHAGRYPEAAARWDEVRKRWPHVPIAWCGSAANRRELGDVHGAREIIAEALRRFPGDLVTITEAIRIHESLGDTAAVLALSREMLRLEPDRPQWRRQLFDRLLAAGLVEEAAAVLDVPAADGDPMLAVRRPLLALRCGDPAEAEAMLRHLAPLADADARIIDELHRAAVERKLRHPGEACLLLAHLRRAKPDDPATRHHLCEALIRAGRHDEAASEIAAALDRFPQDDDLRCDRARLALKTRRWDEAVAAFDDLLSRRPDVSEIASLRAEAVMERAMAALETGPREDGAATPAFAAERQDVGLVEDEAVRRLLLGFESLGQDCEFGLVQRRFGAEPLGLFRWNFTKTAMLREALNQDLIGLGDSEHTAMSLWDDYEYYLSDRRWGFAFHTFVSRHEADRDALFASMCKRLGFLRRKLLTDLAAGDKILVHKTFDADVDTVRALFASLRRHGPVRLLWVRALTHLPDGGAGHQAGLGAEIEPGLVTGYVSAFGNRTNKPWAIAFEEWVALCRAAAAMPATDRARSMEAAG